MTDRIREEQLIRNRDSRDRFDLFAPHRARVTAELLRGGASDSARLCVLGAGNCNDLDLAALSRNFAEIHLVDLETETNLESAAARQQLALGGQLRIHGGVDLSGILMSREEGNRQPNLPAADSAAAWIERAVSFAPPPLPGPFDVVTSVCLLTQLLEAGAMAIGADHFRLLDLIFALRTRHLRLLAELTRPGGWGVLITDVVSSATWPELMQVADADFPRLLAAQIQQRNFFHGVNPWVLRALFTSDPMLAPLIVRSELARPWRWDLGPRQYAVCAIRYWRN